MNNKQIRVFGVPKKNLDSLLPSALKLFEALHLHPCSRDTIAEVLGASPKGGSFAAKLSALQSFGLIDHSRGSYSVSKEAGNYFTPIDDNSKANALINFVLCPEFYREIFKRYSGKPLPVALQNIIAQEKSIPPDRAQKYADAIRINFEFAGLIKNGIVQPIETVLGNDDDASGGHDDQKGGQLPVKPPAPTPPVPTPPAKDNKRATLPLDETDGLVIVEWPKEISKEDYADISDWIDILKRKIERSIVTGIKNELPNDE